MHRSNVIMKIHLVLFQKHPTEKDCKQQGKTGWKPDGRPRHKGHGRKKQDPGILVNA